MYALRKPCKRGTRRYRSKNVDVNLSAKTAVADFNETIKDNKIKDIIKDYGYEVVNIE